MDLTQLPEVLEDIVLDYAFQIEHSLKFKKCLDTIKGLVITRTPIGHMRNSQISHWCEYHIKNDDNFKVENGPTGYKYMVKKVKGRYIQASEGMFDFFDDEYEF